MQDLDQQEKARRSREFRVMLTSALLRPTGGLILAVTVLIAAFVNVWFIPVGLAFYALTVYVSVSDPNFSRQAVNDALYPEKEMDIGRLRGNFRAIMQQALDQKSRIKQAVGSTGSDTIRSSLTQATSGVDDLTDMVYQICYKAQALEQHLSTVNLGQVQSEVSTIQAQVARTNDDYQKQQYTAALSSKQEQLTNLQQVNEALQRWQAQLTNALSGLDTIYSQVLRIKSADVMNMTTATDELSQGLNTQVTQLRNIANAYDAVLSGKIS